MTAPYTLILLRHGQSVWNELNLFTGWVDVRLSEQGKAEAIRGGELLAGSAPLSEAIEDTRLMFQEARLLPWKKIIDNVGLGLKGNWRPQALEALEAVGLAERANEWPAALSGYLRR